MIKHFSSSLLYRRRGADSKLFLNFISKHELRPGVRFCLRPTLIDADVHVEMNVRNFYPAVRQLDR